MDALCLHLFFSELPCLDSTAFCGTYKICDFKGYSWDDSVILIATIAMVFYCVFTMIEMNTTVVEKVNLYKV